MHKRKEIRNAIAAILTTTKEDQFQTLAADRVFTNRHFPIAANDEEDLLPAICVYCLSETVMAFDNLTQKRTAKIVINCLVKEDEEDDFDTLTNQVEYLLVQDETAGGVLSSLELTNVETDVDEQSQRSYLAGILTYDAVYYAPAVADNPIDLFTTAQIDQKDGKYSDTVTLPQS